MTIPISLLGGRVLMADGSTETADLHIADGRIVEAPGADAAVIDCRGHHVLPGIVDVHGDAFEMELHPRPGVDIPFPIAIASIDRQLVSNGITTAFHGLTVSWEPGGRSLVAARRFMGDLASHRSGLTTDHRVQLRWETFAHDAIDDIVHWLGDNPTPALAFNDHTTSTLKIIRSGDRTSLGKWAQRAGVTLEHYVDCVSAVSHRAPDVAAKIRQVSDLARHAGAIMLSHDDGTLRERAANRALGMQVCEFPLAAGVAADAVANDEHVVMGAPNVIRGGSHKGHMSAEEAVREGQCTVLASDYYYPSLLHAAERLAARGVTSVGEAWALISSNPASAMGLHDRGAIEIGRRADIAVIDCAGPWRLRQTITGGRVMCFGM